MNSLNNQALKAAETLVAYIGETVIGMKLRLDQNHEYQNNVLSFHFNRVTKLLEVNHYIAAAGLPDDSSQFKQLFRLVDAALHDPSIGGMYDMDGGQVSLMEAKGVFLYVKEYDPLALSKLEFRKQFQKYLKVAQFWSEQWYLEVARIAHGKREAPTTPVTINKN